MSDERTQGVWVCLGCYARGDNPFWLFEGRPDDYPGREIEGDCSVCRAAADDRGRRYTHPYLRYVGRAPLVVDEAGEAVQPEQSEPSGEA